MILGITGSVGSGKTTAAKMFSGYHYKIIDADEIGHKLLEDSAIRNKLIKNFGVRILGNKKIIDRKKLGKTVFDDERKLEKLNSIMHPIIFREIKTKIKNIQKKYGAKTKIIIDVPLLLETDAKNMVDKVLVIKTFSQNIIKRNKNFSKEMIEKISKFQMPLEEKIKHADFVIDNNGDLKNLKLKVSNLIDKLNQEK